MPLFRDQLRDATLTDPNTMKSYPVGYKNSISVALTASSATQTVFVPTSDIQFIDAYVTFSTASASGTVDIYHDTGTGAPGSGTTMTTGAASLAGTANTPVYLKPATTSPIVKAGDRVSLVIAGTMTSLVGGLITINFAKTNQ
jgi:hypothetical protein